MEAKRDSWNSHEWYNRRLEIQPGRPQMQRYCIRCGRNFVDDLWSDQRYAAHAAIFHFNRLSDEVTARWLIESCPGEHLPSDEVDRKCIDGAAETAETTLRATNGRASTNGTRVPSAPLRSARQRG